MTNPTVSVVIPMHNSSTTIERCIRSVIDQTLSPLEIIAVDDVSSDSTCEIVEHVATASPIPIRLERLHENLGPGITRNTGWDAARGDFIAFLDADDAWHPRKLEIQTQVMVDHPNVVMSCHRHTFTESDEWETSPSSSHRTFGLRSFLLKNRCSTPSVMLRRDIPERFGGGSHSEDYALWMRIVSAHGTCIRIESPLVHCTNPAFGGTGLSGQLVAMERAELAGFNALQKDGLISRPTFFVTSLWSIAKFVVRVTRVALSFPRRHR
jgi:glycosyltransferase involved in cell wall biosynthesis